MADGGAYMTVGPDPPLDDGVWAPAEDEAELQHLDNVYDIHDGATGGEHPAAEDVTDPGVDTWTPGANEDNEWDDEDPCAMM